MSEIISLSTLKELPRDATNADAMEWVNDVRRLLDRWELLPRMKAAP